MSFSMYNWRNILLKAGLDFPRDKVEFSIKCPFHEDRIPSLSINLKKGVWICFAGCGQGNLKGFLKKYLDVSELQLGKMLFSSPAPSFNFSLPSTREDKNKSLLEVEFPFEENKVPKWIFKRGFTKELLKKWGCGYNPESGSLVIPIRDLEKRLVGWTCRQSEGKNPKYIHYQHLEKKKILFGGYNIVKNSRLCLTEGPLDAMWLDQHNYSAVAVLGVYLSSEQREILTVLSPKEIIQCFDGDKEGQKAKERYLPILSKICPVSMIQIPKGYKDVQDIRDSKLLTKVIEERILI